MYTQCPHCQTCFRIAEAHLQAAKGKVRCGSCKEIFDATDHLYDGVPGQDTTTKVKSPVTPPPPPEPATPAKPTASSSIIATPNDDGAMAPRFNEILPGGPEIPEHDHEHIDLSVAPDRSNAPDQSPFMESIYEENSPYNNLDQMGAINIPGEADFSESFIRFAENDEPEDEEDKPLDPATDSTQVVEEPASETEEPKPFNPYQDVDAAMEIPATTQERAAIDELYQVADDQIHDDIDAEDINKHIEALLENELAFDDEITDQPGQDKLEQDIPQAIADGLDNLHINAETDIPLALEDEPSLVPREGDAEPMDVVSSEDIWSKTDETDSAQPTDVKASDKPRPKEEEEEEQAIDIGLDEFLATDKQKKSAEPEIDFDEFLDSGNDGGPDSEFNISAIEASALDVDIKHEPEEEPGPVEAESVKVEDELPSMDHEIPKALRSSFESFSPPIRPIGITMAMVAAIVVLVIGLLGQLILFRSYQLANSMPSIRPVLTALCETLPCRYSGSIDTTKIEVLNRDMRSHPTQKNALLVSTAFVNKAKFNQPYPVIAIKLFDLSGDTVATRYFKPEEYLDSLYNKFLLMESGTPVHITLAVLDPGDDAVNFEFSFL